MNLLKRYFNDLNLVEIVAREKICNWHVVQQIKRNVDLFDFMVVPQSDRPTLIDNETVNIMD